MPTYIVLLNYTEQGIRNIKDSPKRADAFADLARRMGVKIKGLYWTSGEHDGVVVLDGPDGATISRLLLSLAKQGSVRTRTLCAYERHEMESILSGVE